MDHLTITTVAAALATHAMSQVLEPSILVVLAGWAAMSMALPMYILTGYGFLYRCLLILRLEIVYIATLLASIAVYRLCFHKLSRFPGPKAAALSKFYYMSLYVEGKTPQHVQKLHEEYGDIVRIGPNELSIRDASAINDILGINGQMSKGPWYLGSFAKKAQSVHAIRGIAAHAERRKYWDRAFGPKALSDYQVQIRNNTDKFIDCLKKASQQGPVNLSNWCTFLAFDVMGDLGFGHSFGMLDKGQAHFYQEFIETAMKGLSIVSEIPWVMPLLALLPAGRDQEEMYKFSLDTTMERKNRGTGRTDVFSYLVGEDRGAEKAPFTDLELDADVRTVIIAGSDTTASTFTYILYHLLSEPVWLKAVQAEVEHFRGTDFDIQQLARMPALNAVINETLRFNTIVPGRSQRVVTQDNTILANEAIPKGACVSIPFYSIMHDARSFSAPNAWRPQRFISPEKEGAFNNKAFIPFSFGPFNCAGRQLAMLELRLFVAAFALHFNGNLAADFDVRAFLDGVEDRFTIQNKRKVIADLVYRGE